MLAELHNQNKQITICEVPVHIGNEEADKAANQEKICQGQPK